MTEEIHYKTVVKALKRSAVNAPMDRIPSVTYPGEKAGAQDVAVTHLLFRGELHNE
jgi:hypothetical protein